MIIFGDELQRQPAPFMSIKLLSQVAPFIYFGWLALSAVRWWINYSIYESIGKEEFEGNTFNRHVRESDNLLAFFTFRWSQDFMDDEDAAVTRNMRIANVLSIVFIIYTVAVAALWVVLFRYKT